MVSLGVPRVVHASDDWDGFGKDGEEEHLEFDKKILGDSSTSDCMWWSKGHCVALR